MIGIDIGATNDAPIAYVNKDTQGSISTGQAPISALCRSERRNKGLGGSAEKASVFSSQQFASNEKKRESSVDTVESGTESENPAAPGTKQVSHMNRALVYYFLINLFRGRRFALQDPCAINFPL